MRFIGMNQTIAVAGACFLLLLGCLGPGKSTPPQFFVLNSLYSATVRPAPLVDLKELAIGVGPVRMPMQLDRPQILVRTEQNEIRMAADAEWAEPLGSAFSRVLAENLSILLATDKVSRFPWMKPIDADFQVIADVTRFDGTPGGVALLRARWSVYSKGGKRELLKRYTNTSEPVGGDGVADLVQAQSRTVETLSRQIAEAVKALAGDNFAGAAK